MTTTTETDIGAAWRDSIRADLDTRGPLRATLEHLLGAADEALGDHAQGVGMERPAIAADAVRAAAAELTAIADRIDKFSEADARRTFAEYGAEAVAQK